MTAQKTPLYTASTWRRLGAFSVDSLICNLLMLPASLRAWQSYRAYQMIEVEWKWILIAFALQFFYRWVFLKLLSATIGKMLFGLRVVNRHTGAELTWMQALLRVMTDHFSLFFSEAFKVLMFLRFDRTHLSDWVAETRVVQSRPRVSVPDRRPLLATILFLYLAYTGFKSTYHNIQSAEWDSKSVRIQVPTPFQFRK